MNFFKTVLFMVALYFLFASVLFCNSLNENLLLQKANNLYEQHNYVGAISIYKKLCNGKFANGKLFYNIGTAYLKTGKIGFALYWLEKAKFFIPMDRDLNNNIQLAKSRIKDDLKDKTVFKYFNGLFFINNLLSLKSVFYLAVFFFYILIATLIVKLFIFKMGVRRIISRILNVTLILFIYFFLSFSWQYYRYNVLKTGYAVADKVHIKNDFNENASDIAVINDGTKLFIKEKKDNFLRVKLIDGTEGWVNKKFIVF